jgi:lysophospholipase L1-like esterase
LKNRLQQEKTLIIIGSGLIVLGILGNPWLVSALLAPDGHIESARVSLAIMIVQLTFIGLGLFIIERRRLAVTHYIADVIVGILLAVGCTLLLDRVLGLAGYPAQYIPQLAHPANYTGVFRNLEFTYEFRTNSQGLRYREAPLEKPEATTRFVVVGDSFTEGVGVEADQTFTSLLEKRFSTGSKAVEFINCGLAATWPMHYARILFYICMKYDPDAVLIALYANDVAETITSAVPDHIDAVNVKVGLNRVLHALWPRIYTIVETGLVRNTATVKASADHEIDMIAVVSQEARGRGIPEAEIRAWVNRLPPELVAAANRGEFNGQLLSAGLLRPDYWTASLDITGAEAETQYWVMTSILAEMVRRLRAKNIPVGVILIPSPFQYDPDYGHVWRQSGARTRSEWASNETELERRLNIWAQEQALPYLDLTPHYRAIFQVSPGLQLYYPRDGHWTPQGHAIAADQIAMWLRSWILE